MERAARTAAGLLFEGDDVEIVEVGSAAKIKGGHCVFGSSRQVDLDQDGDVRSFLPRRTKVLAISDRQTHTADAQVAGWTSISIICGLFSRPCHAGRREIDGEVGFRTSRGRMTMNRSAAERRCRSLMTSAHSAVLVVFVSCLPILRGDERNEDGRRSAAGGFRDQADAVQPGGGSRLHNAVNMAELSLIVATDEDRNCAAGLGSHGQQQLLQLGDGHRLEGDIDLTILIQVDSHRSRVDCIDRGCVLAWARVMLSSTTSLSTWR